MKEPLKETKAEILLGSGGGSLLKEHMLKSVGLDLPNSEPCPKPNVMSSGSGTYDSYFVDLSTDHSHFATESKIALIEARLSCLEESSFLDSCLLEREIKAIRLTFTVSIALFVTTLIYLTGVIIYFSR